MVVNEKYNGENKAEYFSFVSFGKQAEVINQYLSKGSTALIEGKHLITKSIVKKSTTAKRNLRKRIEL